jgi:hypothetical protein
MESYRIPYESYRIAYRVKSTVVKTLEPNHTIFATFMVLSILQDFANQNTAVHLYYVL